MKIRKVFVTDVADPTESGIFYVKDSSSDDFPFQVRYLSPFLVGNLGGFVAIPSEGTPVLICQPDNENAWYYMGTIAEPQEHLSIPPVEGSLPDDSRNLPDPQIYAARGIPQRYLFKSPLGNAIILSDEYRGGKIGYANIKTELISSEGKKVSLIDSPKIDSIILQNESGDQIVISNKPDGAPIAPRSIKIDTGNNVDIKARSGHLNLIVVDGQDINIDNKSTGQQRINEFDSEPGNININSDNADVNITCRGSGGTVTVRTEGSGGNIILEAEDGIVQIKGKKGISIESEGAIQIVGTTIDLN